MSFRVRFVGSALKEGQTYEFPSAFLDYQIGKFYLTAEEIKAMPPGKATLEFMGPCSSLFKTADGKKFWIGYGESKREVWQFLETLEEGMTYEFPSAFLDFQKKK